MDLIPGKPSFPDSPPESASSWMPTSLKGKEMEEPSPTSAEHQQLSPDDVLIAVMGVTGCGKTTFISKLCPVAAEDIGHGLESQTAGITAYSFMMGEMKVHLIDTPGFDDTFRSDVDILVELASWLSATYQQKLQLDSILYLHRIADKRMGGSSMKNLRIFTKLCGSESLSSVALVTTMWDTVDHEIGAAREKQLLAGKSFWGSMIDQGSVTFRHTGTAESAKRVVSWALRRKFTTILQIQKELVDEGKTLLDTSAGREVNRDLEELRSRYEQELQEIRALTQQAERNQENQSQYFVEEMAKCQDSLRMVEKEQHGLHHNHVGRFLAEKDKEVKEMSERHRQETLRLEYELADKESVIQSLQEIYERRTFEGFLQSEVPLVKPSEENIPPETTKESILLANIRRERDQWKREREELQKQLDPQQLLRAMLEQLGVVIREYPAEAPPSYEKAKVSGFEKAHQNPENDSSSLSQQFPSSLPLTQLNQVNRRKLVRPPLSRLKQLHGLWKKFRRPKTPENYRRVEWICECGDELYADFENTDAEAINEIERLLKGDDMIDVERPLGDSPSDGEASGPSTSSKQVPTHSVPPPPVFSNPTAAGDPASSNSAQANTPRVSTAPRPPKPVKKTSMYLALCINTGSMYKTLFEFDVSSKTSDAEVFRVLRDAYVNLRGLRTIHSYLMTPVDVHFVHFHLWHLRERYITIHDRPTCLPPPDSWDYEYDPRPLRPRGSLPFPPIALLHYLRHKDDEFLSTKRVWTPRLPKRIARKVIQHEIGTEGWGIHIVEGPNRDFIFWVIMVTTFGGILATVLWSVLQRDIQGGTRLGALVLAVPTVVLAACLFRLNGV